ncbi:nicotinate-nucleotide adenylyltransferase [Caldisalinibacter kiritimatiensis]|uniref:Probable nicotinate-nucleotide adenylyltransferase n=1 Tax=Caldisalinibacter kiritimatiensis TaxID=1304284 RepID=R1ARN3_9FIRM|nr:nicotinate-nucleotide adenylyltransferase [Caldisalinibacter kiritimatiensis]EOC99807.1 Nicotinate-nucleotide adenylyltransferase [Caldisalinibacter kiritimatiensis]
MKGKKIKYGIMGGTFDPIHIGHLVVAEEVRDKFELDKVIFVPSGTPPHKKPSLVTKAKHRYMMTLLATITNPDFEVSSIEIDRKGVTYTIDTIKAFKEKFNNVEFYFITGADAIMEITTWKSTEELLKICNFVAVSRPGFKASNMEKQISMLEQRYNAKIHTMVIPALEISSTDIRNRIKEDRPVKYLLPESIEQYIKKNGLYK